eukprot:TRINITY_DN9270_c0_g1_i1.p2 TRINITY_DN9270_c0_g1~~TRINITY_DN9270_c0_g1_i1.p2  ORF type:complete len:510 (+),score=118.23 TRINITY_DN9270_c0_g1_i1:64-1593(+)
MVSVSKISKAAPALAMGVIFLSSPFVSLIIFSQVMSSSLLRTTMLPILAVSAPIGIIILTISWKFFSFDAFTRSTKISIFMSFVFTFYCFLASLMYTYLFLFHHVDTTFEKDWVWLWALKGLMLYLHACVLIQMAALSKCRLRSALYRRFISWPSSFFFTCNVLSLPLYYFVPFLPPWAMPLPFIIPFTVAALGLFQTLHSRHYTNWDKIDIYVGARANSRAGSKSRGPNLLLDPSQNLEVRRGAPPPPLGQEREEYRDPLRIVQITDPHIGPIMSIERLQYICANALKQDPHVVVLTGDFYTAEAYCDPDAITKALAPLASMCGHLVDGVVKDSRVFACLGNHDKEGTALQQLTAGLRAAGVRLLVDEGEIITVEGSEIQIVGLDFKFPRENPQGHVQDVLTRIVPPLPGIPRVLLIHDPGVFQHLPATEEALMLSGHTHGGQVGLLSFGIHASVVSLAGVPDSGLWTRGSSCLYVNRGQGTRSMMGNMMLRAGVPTEESLMRVHFEL